MNTFQLSVISHVLMYSHIVHGLGLLEWPSWGIELSNKILRLNGSRYVHTQGHQLHEVIIQPGCLCTVMEISP